MQIALVSLLVASRSVLALLPKECRKELINAIKFAQLELRDQHCSQCGQLYWNRACGPTHAVVTHALNPKNVI